MHGMSHALGYRMDLAWGTAHPTGATPLVERHVALVLRPSRIVKALVVAVGLRRAFRSFVWPCSGNAPHQDAKGELTNSKTSAEGRT